MRYRSKPIASFQTLLLVIVILFGALSIASDANEHIQRLIQQLPANSMLRRDLLAGARGDGVHRPWMGRMQQQHVKRATVWIAVQYNRHGRSEKLRISRVRYFDQYEDVVPINNAQQLSDIRSCGLEKQLTDVALQKAKGGFWVDVPRPRPRPFIGGTRIDFFDDEWLPTIERPGLCAGEHCLD